jgi:hypothetical protein
MGELIAESAKSSFASFEAPDTTELAADIQVERELLEKHIIKKVYALSGNRCAFPDCDVPIVDPATGNVLCELCHTAAASGNDDLILLCPKHRAIIDSGACTAGDLQRLKGVRDSLPKEEICPADELIRALQQTIGSHSIDRGSVIVPQGMTGGQAAHTIVNLSPSAVAASIPRYDQIVFRFHDFSARFMGQDSYGGACPAKLADAKSVAYSVKVDIYNARLAPTGLMDIYILFSKDGRELLRHVPGKHTGETRAAQAYCPNVTCMSLASNEWTSEIFRGALWNEQFAAVVGCDEIALVATTVDGIAYRFRLGNGIREP